MRCEQKDCICGNKEIPEEEMVADPPVIRGIPIKVPYCKAARAKMKEDYLAYKPMNPSRKKKP